MITALISRLGKSCKFLDLDLLEGVKVLKFSRHGGVWLLREVTLIGITGPSWLPPSKHLKFKTFKTLQIPECQILIYLHFTTKWAFFDTSREEWSSWRRGAGFPPRLTVTSKCFSQPEIRSLVDLPQPRYACFAFTSSKLRSSFDSWRIFVLFRV